MIGTTEAAEIVGCGPSHIKHLCHEGKLEGAKKIGRTWIIPEETIRAFKLTRPRVKKS